MAGKLDERERLAADMKQLERQVRRLCRDRLTPAEEDRLRILDLACGECFEGGMLPRVMRELSGPGSGDADSGEMAVEFVGADIREREIARAAERFSKKVGMSEVDYRFLVKNGGSIRGDRDLDGEFDVVFVRHQNFYLGSKEWQTLFEQSLEKLAPGGKLLITSYFDHEHELAKEAIQGVGGKLVEDIVNQGARALATPGKRVDKRLALFRKGG